MQPLDNSTLTAYRECPRKAYFRYVKHWRTAGLEPIYFSFGSAWHSGLDALYSAFYEARSTVGTLPLSGTGCANLMSLLTQ